MKNIEGQFESIAEQYVALDADEQSSRYEMQVNWPSIQAMLPTSPAKVLDYGCGSGVYGRLLLAQGYDVVLADNTPGMLAPLEDMKKRTRLWNYNDGPLPEIFDAVVAKLVVQFVDDLPQFADSMRRQLRLGGRLIISIPNPTKSKKLADQQHSDREYTDEISASGLTVTMIHRDFHEYESIMKAAHFRFRQADTPVDPRALHSPPKRLNMLFEAVK